MGVRAKLKALTKRWRRQSEEDVTRDLEHLYSNLSPIDFVNLLSMVTTFELTLGTEERGQLLRRLSVTEKRVVLGRDRSLVPEDEPAEVFGVTNRLSSGSDSNNKSPGKSPAKSAQKSPACKTPAEE